MKMLCHSNLRRYSWTTIHASSFLEHSKNENLWSIALHPMQPAVDSGLHQVDQPKLARYSYLHWQPPQPQPQAELYE